MGWARLVGDGVVVIVDELLLLDDIRRQLALSHDGDARLGVRVRFGVRVRVRPTSEMPAWCVLGLGVGLGSGFFLRLG